ncbi:MAG: tyrosine-type recombinase/integrase [Candidatus Actinomarina sp.]|jgi:integrase/recombinase XerD|tara:strand:- start:628 stop:1506 length:879 start_codon:yes stop_codon:yes gene_type:complete
MKQKLEINSLIDSYKDFLIYEKGLSENTVSAYISDINKVSGQEEYFDIENFLPDTYLMSSNNKNYSGSTKKRIQSSINQFLKYLIDENYIANIEINNVSIMSEKKLPHVLSPNEIDKLIDFYNHDLFISSRNKTIIDFMYSTGCRVSELINVEESDIDIEEAFVRLEGKGSKQRIVPLGSKVLINLESYLPLRNKDRKSKNNKLFISKSYKNLDRTAVFRIIKSTGVKAGIHKELYPHILRHSAATHMLEGGCDLRTVQEFLGHSSVSTTQIYTKVTKAFLEEAFIESHPRS